MTEKDSAKFFVRADGSSVMQKRGDLTDKEITIIQKFIQAESYFSAFPSWIQ